MVALMPFTPIGTGNSSAVSVNVCTAAVELKSFAAMWAEVNQRRNSRIRANAKAGSKRLCVMKALFVRSCVVDGRVCRPHGANLPCTVYLPIIAEETASAIVALAEFALQK